MATRLCAVLLLLAVCSADIYLHNLKGSNDRNREKNQNRNNGNLIFDSQNNDKGGYPWGGDREADGDTATAQNTNNPMGMMNLYEGSIVELRWASQHACGPNANTHCQTILQYGLDTFDVDEPQDGGDWTASLRALPNLRDGWPTGNLQDYPNNNGNNQNYQYRGFNGGQNNDGTERQNADGNDKEKTDYVQHESWWFYEYNQEVERNKGLYIADQNVQNNQGSLATRQNPNGDQRGLEVPEERDYYPWWRPSPWRDIGVQVSNTSWCDYLVSESQNTKARGFCNCGEPTQDNGNNGDTANNPADCTGNCQWETMAPFNIAPPECTLHAQTRDNHLGNAIPVQQQGDAYSFQTEATDMPEPASQTWTVPTLPGGNYMARGVVRIRYNITGGDADFIEGMAGEPSVFDAANNIDDDDDGDDERGANCKLAAGGCLGATPQALYNRPYVVVNDQFQAANSNNGNNAEPVKLALAINTNQNGRTFQDRSFVFQITKRTTVDMQSAPIRDTDRIFNLNANGGRGNIVQRYPSVEYDFVPNQMKLCKDDFVHWQWAGSDFNPNRNPNNAEGWRYSDRANVVSSARIQSQMPAHNDDQLLFPNQQVAQQFAFSGQNTADCDTRYDDGENDDDNDEDNCGKLNAAAATFDAAPMKAPQSVGRYDYVNTRNNNFSNRSQKSAIHVVCEGSNDEWNFGEALSGGAIAGIVIGAVVGVGIIGGGGYYAFKKGMFSGGAKAPPPPPPGGPMQTAL